jgi:hypothetical protein
MNMGDVFTATSNLNAMIATFFLGLASMWWLMRDKGKEENNGKG